MSSVLNVFSPILGAYRREASVVSSSILISTLGSLVTLSICLYVIKG